MSEHFTGTYTFGNNQSFDATRLTHQHSDGKGFIHKDSVDFDRVTINRYRYEYAIEDINNFWRVIKDRRTGKRFEIAAANTTASADEGVDVELSTYTSSISGNAGNAVEFAEHSALHPDRQRLYVASFGNGKSSYWSEAEQRYIKETGRFIQEDGEALPTVAALNRALNLAGYVITRASTNSSGGAVMTALMSELPEGQVTHAYIKSRTNISNHPSGLAWGINVLIGDLRDDGKYKKASNDPWKMTGEMVDKAKKQMPRIFAPDSPGQESIPEDVKTHGIGKMWTDLRAFSRGGEAKNNPAALDTIQALRQQPDALLTYHFPFNDRLYNNMPDDIINFMHRILFLGQSITDGQIESLIMPGAHRDHTSYPALRWSAESYAFNR